MLHGVLRGSGLLSSDLDDTSWHIVCVLLTILITFILGALEEDTLRLKNLFEVLSLLV